MTLLSPNVDTVDAQMVPSIKLPQSGLSGPGIVAVAAVAAIALFLIMNQNRSDRASSLVDKSADAGFIASPAELNVSRPEASKRGRAYDSTTLGSESSLGGSQTFNGQVDQRISARPSDRANNSPATMSPAPSQPIYRDATSYFPQGDRIDQPAQPAIPEVRPPDNGSALVIDRGLLRRPVQGSKGVVGNPANDSSFIPLRPEPPNMNAYLMPAGTMIPAVLETALNTSRPGVARALVTKDMRGPDGKEILIKRGARIIGQYSSDVSPGQDRVLITWERLILPDGRQVKIAAPATDREGASGIQGKVHSNAFGRFLSSIFRSALDIATFRAINRSGGDSIILAIPDSARGASQELVPAKQYQRSVTVPAGAKLSVFVTQDIDFFKPDSFPGGGNR